MNRREDLLLITDPVLPASGYRVTAYSQGGQVVTSVGTALTLRAGHGFIATDKLLIMTVSSGTITVATYRTVNSVAGNVLTLNATVAASNGDYAINLGPDSGGVTPNYDGSRLDIYQDMAGFATYSNSEVTADAFGNYGYWYSGGPVWELVRTPLGVPHALQIWSNENIFDVTDFGAVADNSTDNASAFAAAVAAADAVTRVNGMDAATIRFPGPGVFKYSSGLNPTKPIILAGFDNAQLDYTGSGKAVEMGPTGLTAVTYVSHLTYEIQNLTWKGGTSMTHGVYWNNFITSPRMRRCRFLNFGNASAYALWFNSSNWDIQLWDLESYNVDDGTARNFLRVRGDGDFGQSRLTMYGGSIHEFGTVAGMGIWVNGIASRIFGTTVQGYAPCVRVGSWASYSKIDGCYFEVTDVDIAACIQYGDPAGGDQPSAYVAGLVVDRCYCNTHNSDYGTVDYFIGPSGVATGLESARIVNNVVTLYTAARELVLLNNSASQVNNTAHGNVVNNSSTSVVPATSGSNIQRWNGLDTEQVASQSFTASGSIDTLNKRLVAITQTSGASNVITLTANNRDGARLTLLMVAFGTGTFTIQDTASVNLSANWVPNVSDTLELVSFGSVWYELSRSSN